MTEAEWMTCTDFSPMHSYLWKTEKNRPRKYRLAGCGIFRLIRQGTLSDQESQLLDLGESFADDPSLSDRVDSFNPEDIPSNFCFEVCYPPFFHSYDSNSVARVVSFMQDRLADQWWEQHNFNDEDEAQVESGRQFRRQADVVGATVLRDVFGNPFRPVAFDPAWQTDIALSLARQMYESRDFSAMPILADALQDAGCDNDDVLNHCRGPGPHVRGCWAVDLVLGKE
jgi:hypothetical protein